MAKKKTKIKKKKNTKNSKKWNKLIELNNKIIKKLKSVF